MKECVGHVALGSSPAMGIEVFNVHNSHYGNYGESKVWILKWQILWKQTDYA
jgi:hypothetical protein